MKLVAFGLMSFAVATSVAWAGESCLPATVLPAVEAAPGKLTLAELLAPQTCAEIRRAAEQVNLGAAPLLGSVRVLDGRQIGALLAQLAGAPDSSSRSATKFDVPDRIVVKRAGATKSCAELARFLVAASLQEKIAGTPPDWERQVDCAAAPAIPENAELEVVKTGWNGAVGRWEFRLRCTRAEDCVPFLLWVRETKTANVRFSALPKGGRGSTPEPGPVGARLVRPGQSATLIWDQAGIRMVLPVTCLDAGGLGEIVRVRFKSAPRMLRAEVLGDGILRASL